jgi:hypothetical protein
VTRVVDKGAIVAAYVGIGMAVTIGVSFLLVIPIEPIFWYLMIPAGLLIGYYANQRANRRTGPWRRILANALFAGLVTAITAALLLLVVKALFFVADNGYRDAALGGPITCRAGADCVYRRYLDQGQGPDLVAAGVTDADSFARVYWRQQLETAALLVVLPTLAALGGGLLYGYTRPKASAGTATLAAR